MKTWTCLFLGGPLDGRWITTEKYRAYRAAEPVTRVAWSDLSEVSLGEFEGKISTYVPRRFHASGWRFPLDIYVHDSLGIWEPMVPIGTVVPGGLVGMGNSAMPLCRVCYSGPTVEGYPFCERTDPGGMTHAALAAEIVAMEHSL